MTAAETEGNHCLKMKKMDGVVLPPILLPVAFRSELVKRVHLFANRSQYDCSVKASEVCWRTLVIFRSGGAAVIGYSARL